MRSMFSLDACPELGSRIRRLVLHQPGIEAFADHAANARLFCSARRAVQLRLRDQFAECFGKECLPALKEVIRNRQHGAVVCSSLSAGREASSTLVEAVLVALSVGIGRPYAAPGSGRCIVQNELVDPTRDDGSGRSPYRHDPLHTDGHGFDSVSEDYIGIACVDRFCCHGGESVLMHIDDWSACEKFRKAAVDVRFRFEIPDPSRPTVKHASERPLFYSAEGEEGLRMNYLPGYMHPASEYQRELLQQLRVSLKASMDDSRVASRFLLECGDFYCVDNGFWLHGRMPLEPDAALYRRLLQMRGCYC